MAQGKKAFYIVGGLGLVSLLVFVGAFVWGIATLRAARHVDLTTAMIADEAIPAGATLTYRMIKQRDLPTETVTAGMLRPEESGVFVGQTALVDIPKGEPLLRSQFAASPPEPLPVQAEGAAEEGPAE